MDREQFLPHVALSIIYGLMSPSFVSLALTCALSSRFFTQLPFQHPQTPACPKLNSLLLFPNPFLMLFLPAAHARNLGPPWFLSFSLTQHPITQHPIPSVSFIDFTFKVTLSPTTSHHLHFVTLICPPSIISAEQL